MFLSKLSEQEKQAFMVLAKWVSEADGIVKEEETLLLNAFLKEMDLIEIDSTLTVEDCYLIFSKSSNVIKRAAYIELLSLVIADKKYDKKEEEILSKINNNFGLPEDFIAEAFNWLKAYTELTAKGFQLVDGVL